MKEAFVKAIEESYCEILITKVIETIEKLMKGDENV